MKYNSGLKKNISSDYTKHFKPYQINNYFHGNNMCSTLSSIMPYNSLLSFYQLKDRSVSGHDGFSSTSFVSRKGW